MSTIEKVHFDVGAALARNASGAFTGRVAVRVGGTAFPDAEWLDFVDIVAAWAEEIAAQPNATLRFMDGPHEIRVDRVATDDDRATLTLVTRTVGGTRVVKAAEVSWSQLAAALRVACVSLAAAFRAAGHDDEAVTFQEAAAMVT